MIKYYNTNIDGVKVLCLNTFKDNRGSFMELWNNQHLKEIGIHDTFVQDNLSTSKTGVLRGVHTQLKYPQAKIVSCLNGMIFDVAVDCRIDSITYGKWHGEILSAENHKQLYLPAGVAHGFLAITDSLVHMKVSTHYIPGDEIGFIWNDKTIGIEWPSIKENFIFALKDLQWKSFNEMMALIQSK